MDSLSSAARNGRTLPCGTATFALAFVVPFALPIGCGPGFDDGDAHVVQDELEEREGAAPSQVPATKREDGASLTYYQHTTFDAEDQMLDGVIWGELDEPTRQRVARPYRHLHESVVFEEIARDAVDEDGIRSNEYSVWAHENVRPAALPRWSGPAYYTRAASELVDRAWTDGETHTVTIGIRDFPEWDVPLPPDPTFTSEADVKVLMEAREAAMAARSEAFLTATNELRAYLDGAGAKVEAMGDKGAWIAATVDHETFLGLGARDDVSTIALEEGGVESGWPVGRSGTAARMDSQVFVDNGYDGMADSGRSNYAGYTRMMIAVIDDGIQSDARFLCDSAFVGQPGSCPSSRLAEMFTCDDPDGDGNFCEPVTTFPSNGDNGFGWQHGTSVAAAAVADFTAGQGDGWGLGDPTWTNNTCGFGGQCGSLVCSPANKCKHDPTWEQDATGMSPRAKLVFFGHSGPITGPALGQADAFDDAVDRHVDIISISQGNLAQRCDPVADSATEKEAEVAYDDGIFIAACGGNAAATGTDCAPSGPCNTWSPGSLAKTFAVVGLDSLAPGCDSNYHIGCPLANGSSCPGGADVLTGTISGYVYHPAVASLVDLVAPARLSHGYQAEDWSQSPVLFEEVKETGIFGGCSTATPILAGAAANVKDFQISIGNIWINYPGRLHAMMLAMGDRAGSTIGKLSSSSHDRWGMGRAKLRYLGSGGITPNAGLTWTTSLTRGGSNRVTTLRTTPLTSAFVFAKCVTFQHEDFSNDFGTPFISDIDLVVRVREPVNGACVAGAGTIVTTVSDHALDWKRMVQIFASSVSGGFTGRCIDVTLENDDVEVEGETVTIRCWAGGEDDAT